VTVSRPSVCICIPTYNASATLPATLDSLLRQTYDGIIIIKVVDNASTDDTVAVAREYARSLQNIDVRAFSENIGAEGNFTRCIQLAEGDYTAIYHADDLYEPEMVEKQVAFLKKHREAGAVLTGARYIDARGKELGLHVLPREIRHLDEALYDFPSLLKSVLRCSNFLMCPSAMVRTSVYLQEIRIWDGGRFGTSADLDVWLRISQQHKVGIITAPLMRYRVSHRSFSYHYARTRLQPMDMLLVLDDYVARYGAALLDEQDLKRYRLFSFKDSASRSLNALINDDRRQARDVAKELFTAPALSSMATTPRGALYAVIGCAAYVLSLIPIGRTGRRMLHLMKFGPAK